MAKLSSRLRRLDEILGDLDVDDPMLLSELDGYVAGIAVCPTPVEPIAWLPPIWDGLYGEGAPFEEPLDSPLFTDMVLAHHAAMLRDLDRGRYQPIFDVDERNREVLWEIWIAGFDLALVSNEGAWASIAGSGDDEAIAALSYLTALGDIARNDTALTSIDINAISDAAPAAIPGQIARLYAYRTRQIGAVPAPAAPAPKAGRNDPCACGSGKKHKRCCGAG